MQGFELAAQRAVFDTLDGALGCQVHDSVDFLPEGVPATGFPYCVIGHDTARAWDADDLLGAQVTVTLHFWSRADRFRLVKELMGEAYGLLHRAAPVVAGFRVIDCLWEFGETLTDPDGKTKHGVQRYRLTIQEATA